MILSIDNNTVAIVLFTIVILALIVFCYILYVAKPSSKMDQEEVENSLPDTELGMNKLYQRLSNIAKDAASSIQIPNDEEGVKVVGVMFNKKSEVYFYDPDNQVLNIGDLVIVDDESNQRVIVPVVVSNQKDSCTLIKYPLKKISSIIYRN